MQSLRLALVPGLIAGIISIFTSWLFMGVIFHRYQAETPETWRDENKGSYALSSLLHLGAGIALATLFLLIAHPANSPFALGPEHGLAFGVVIWLALAVPMALDAAIYVRLHPLVLVGQLLDWLATSVLACGITAWWWHT